MAGAFIAFGAVLYTYVIHDSSLSLGLTKLLGGLVFCLGLILVIVAGAELFTGNNLIVMAYVSRKITLERVLRNWIIVFTGNLVGSFAVVFLISQSGQWTTSGAAVGVKALMIANGKVDLTFVQALSLGILITLYATSYYVLSVWEYIILLIISFIIVFSVTNLINFHTDRYPAYYIRSNTGYIADKLHIKLKDPGRPCDDTRVPYRTYIRDKLKY